MSSHAVTLSLKQMLTSAFQEDMGFGDLTVDSILSDSDEAGVFIAKAPGVLAGLRSIRLGYQILDPAVSVNLLKTDADPVKPGDVIAEVEGPVSALLTGERVILNMIQHLSGIATATAGAVEAVGENGPRICDTRKTLPGLRSLQKYAVRCGGGFNHRFRLDDGVMIKDNHIAAAGSIRAAVEAVRSRVGLMVRVEVECETREQVVEAVEAGADIIMLDNKSPEEVVALRREIPPQILVELSGGITTETVGRYRETGADYISLGSLTHSVTALDISFNLTRGDKFNLTRGDKAG